MKRIKLTKNKFAIVDDDMFDYLNQWRWHYAKVGYAARRKFPEKKIIYLHRFITDCPKGLEVDHINHNKLDNQKNNLRICTHRQNGDNTTLPKNNTSGYKGVTWNKQRNKWQASLETRNGLERHRKHLGLFDSKIDAAEAYNKRAIELFGEYANLNRMDVI